MIAVTVRRFWPALVGGMLLIGAATLLWWGGFSEAPAGVESDDSSAPLSASDPAADYLAFASRFPSRSATTEVLVEGLRKLAGALGTLDHTPAEVPVDLRVAAEHVLLNPDAAGTTEVVRNCLVAAADALERDDTRHAPLRMLAEAIDRGMPLAQQREELVRFFILAAEALQTDANTHPTT